MRELRASVVGFFRARLKNEEKNTIFLDLNYRLSYFHDKESNQKSKQSPWKKKINEMFRYFGTFDDEKKCDFTTKTSTFPSHKARRK